MVINSRLSWWKISSRYSTVQFERPISDVLLCLQEGAFDEAVKGVDAIEHTASPFHTNVTEPEGRVPAQRRVLESNRLLSEFFRPAIQGTVGILKSAFKNG